MAHDFLESMPAWAWLAAATFAGVGILSKPWGRKVVGAGLIAVGRLLATPFVGAASERFRRFQRDKRLVVPDVNDSGVISEHAYLRIRRNIFPRGTFDIWLPAHGAVSPSDVAEFRRALGWYLRKDEAFIQDFAPIRGRRVRLYGRTYYPKLEGFRVSGKKVRAAIGRVPLGVYLGRAAGRKNKHLVVSLADQVLLLGVGRPGSGKSLLAGWVVTSLRFHQEARPNLTVVVYDHSGTDHQHYGSSVSTLNTLSELAAYVAELEEEAARRLVRMREAGRRCGEKVSDVGTYERLTGDKESLAPRVLVVDEMQELFGRRLTGDKAMQELKKSIAERINALAGTYRKVGLHVCLFGTVSQAGELPVLQMSSVGIRIAGALGHPETSKAFFGGGEGADLAANDSLRQGRLVLLAALNNGLPPRPLVFQLPVGLKAGAKKPRKAMTSGPVPAQRREKDPP